MCVWSQFQVEEGEHNETDISGDCELQYQVDSPLLVRKFKVCLVFKVSQVFFLSFSS